MKKIAVVLFNLGGPDNEAAVRPFLFNLFNDPAIIRLPSPLRQCVAWMISSRREKTAQGIYQKMGGGSPILKNTQDQAEALQNTLVDMGEVKCFIAMRYWHPFVEQILLDVQKFAPDEIVLLPLYPQFSTTTTASSLLSWHKTVARTGLKVPTKTICCYPDNAGFISALAANILNIYREAQSHGTPRILFSAHGLPEKIVKAGDPYQWQCEQTVKALVMALNIPNLDWSLCYQSRVGPMTWIGPATDDEVKRAASDKVPLVVVPIAFVSEHSETLVELDIEYRHLAMEHGAVFYGYVPTVSIVPAFIAGLAGLVRQASAQTLPCQSGTGQRICPPEFTGCCQRAS